MPILEFSTTTIKQECLACGSIHTIPLKQGVAKSKKEPYGLADGDTLEIKVDGSPTPQVITFSADDFVNIGAATAAEVVAKINASLTGAAADVDGNAVRIVSASAAKGTTSIEVSGGSARSKLGFDGRKYGPRVLGMTIGTGAGKHTAPDTIDLPHCPDCGSKECLVRTWDTAPPEVADSLHAKHRKVVNALAQHLKTHGYSDADAKVIHDAETAAPPDIDTASLTGPNRSLSSARGVPRSLRGSA
jgi:hypothetical protein